MVIFRPKHLHSKLEDNKVVYPGSIDAFTMKKFLKDAVHGMVGHMTPSNEDQFKKPICVVYYAVDYIRNIKGEVCCYLVSSHRISSAELYTCSCMKQQYNMHTLKACIHVITWHALIINAFTCACMDKCINYIACITCTTVQLLLQLYC